MKLLEEINKRLTVRKDGVAYNRLEDWVIYEDSEHFDTGAAEINDLISVLQRIKAEKYG